MLKKSLAMVAIAGMLASPLALAQGSPGGAAAGGGAPVTGGIAGISAATGLSVPLLAGIGTITVVGIAIAIANSGDGSTSTGT